LYGHTARKKQMNKFMLIQNKNSLSNDVVKPLFNNIVALQRDQNRSSIFATKKDIFWFARNPSDISKNIGPND
jgi:hypothetical protein